MWQRYDKCLYTIQAFYVGIQAPSFWLASMTIVYYNNETSIPEDESDQLSQKLFSTIYVLWTISMIALALAIEGRPRVVLLGNDAFHVSRIWHSNMDIFPCFIKCEVRRIDGNIDCARGMALRRPLPNLRYIVYCMRSIISSNAFNYEYLQRTRMTSIMVCILL